MRGLLVTATDTGVGKTYVAAALCRALRERGERVVAFKPVVTGTDDPGPTDHARLAEATGADEASITPHVFAPPVSPHLAAALAGVELSLDRMVAGARAAGADGRTVVVEGVGGLLVPLTPDRTVRDLAEALALPLVVVARAGLGTINHTLMTLEVARMAGLEVRGVVLTPFEDDLVAASNRSTIERLGGVPVATLAPGATDVPLDAWLP